MKNYIILIVVAVVSFLVYTKWKEKQTVAQPNNELTEYQKIILGISKLDASRINTAAKGQILQNLEQSNNLTPVDNTAMFGLNTDL